jgi:hypothetical protein
VVFKRLHSEERFIVVMLAVGLHSAVTRANTPSGRYSLHRQGSAEVHVGEKKLPSCGADARRVFHNTPLLHAQWSMGRLVVEGREWRVQASTPIALHAFHPETTKNVWIQLILDPPAGAKAKGTLNFWRWNDAGEPVCVDSMAYAGSYTR